MVFCIAFLPSGPLALHGLPVFDQHNMKQWPIAAVSRLQSSWAEPGSTDWWLNCDQEKRLSWR
jgi:hypothetical protein